MPPATYAANLERILDALLDRLPPDRIVTVTIPDYTVTPAGADYGDPRRQHDAIVAANATMTRLAANAGIACVDIVRSLAARRGTIGRSSRPTGSTRAARSTPPGWSASHPSSPASSPVETMTHPLGLNAMLAIRFSTMVRSVAVGFSRVA